MLLGGIDQEQEVVINPQKLLRETSEMIRARDGRTISKEARSKLFFSNTDTKREIRR